MTDRPTDDFTFDDLRQISNEAKRVEALYGELFQEENRLQSSPAARVEWLTTMRAMERVLRPGDRVLDLGAGTGAYSLPLAQRGHAVTAIELATRNVQVFKQNIQPGMDIDLRQGSAVDLSGLPDQSFDLVLLLGPLYHLEDEADRARCLQEARRVLAPGGRLFAGFIHHDAIPYTESMRFPEWWLDGSYNPDTLRIGNFPFVFFTIQECRDMLTQAGFDIQREIAPDGLSELMADAINRMSEESYQRFLQWHWYTCEQPAFLGASNHLLFEAVKAA